MSAPVDTGAERERGPILPSRYEEVLNQRITEEAVRIATRVQEGPGVTMPRWGVPVMVIGVGLAVVLMLLGQSEASGPTSRVAFDRSAVISAGAVGARAEASDLIPPSPSPVPPPATTAPASDFASKVDVHHHDAKPGSATPAAATPRPHKAKPATAAPAPPAEEPACTTCQTPRAEAAEVSATEPSAGPVPSPSPVIPQVRTVLNLGARFPVSLTFPVNTAFSGAPVTATLGEDVVAHGKVVIPAGAQIVGEAFATQFDDRAQIAFSAIVHDGTTIPLRGIAIGADNQLGVSGKVIRKASAKKKGLGRILGSLGQAATFGLIGRGDGVLEEAGAIMASQTANDLTHLDRNWTIQRSDKVVEVKAGTKVTVYVQTDFKMPVVVP